MSPSSSSSFLDVDRDDRRLMQDVIDVFIERRKTLDSFPVAYQQRLLDASTPHVGRRWAALAALVLLYALRVWYLQGFYIVTYALGIYNLNLLLGFLTPQVRFFLSQSHFHSINLLDHRVATFFFFVSTLNFELSFSFFLKFL